MALQGSLTLMDNHIVAPEDAYGSNVVTYPAAYARLMFVRVDTQRSYLLVAWYEDAAARERGENPFHIFEFNKETAALVGDIYPAAYTHLKTLPEFSGFNDC